MFSLIDALQMAKLLKGVSEYINIIFLEFWKIQNALFIYHCDENCNCYFWVASVTWEITIYTHQDLWHDQQQQKYKFEPPFLTWPFSYSFLRLFIFLNTHKIGFYLNSLSLLFLYDDNTTSVIPDILRLYCFMVTNQ